MLVSKTIPSLISGVSQQPDSLRLSTQCEAQDNLYSSVVEGLKDRPPTEHIAKIYTGAIGDAYAHTINRGAGEQYEVLIRNGDLTVHTLAGVAKTVTFPDGKAYLNTSTPSTSIRAITVANYTFVLNTEKVPALDAAVTASRLKEGLIFVRQGAYGTNYRVFIDGVERALKLTSTTSVADIATDVIAEGLRSDLATWAGANYTITRKGSVVHIQKVSGDFKLTVSDGQGGSSLFAFKDSTPNFAALPTMAPTDFQITIVGDTSSASDDFHVKFVPATTGETFGEGAWEECVGMNVQATISPTNMVHTLVRNVDGTFTFQNVDWDLLTVGDATSVATPTFIGNTINDVFFWKNRLGFLSQDSIIMSGVGQYFNFWPTTVTTEVDDDRIDYQVSHTKVPILRSAVTFDEKMVLLSDQTQFIAQGAPIVSSRTLQVDPTTEFESSSLCKPIGSGKNVYFVFPRGQYAGLREYFVDTTTAVKDAVDITAQVPKYIPAGCHRLITSTTENIVIALTSGASNTMFMYKFFYAGDEKLQSAWDKMTMGDSNVKVLGGEFIESVLYLTIQRSDGVYLEKCNFAPGTTDAGVNFVTHYDRRITEAQCVSVVYNAGSNTTTWTLPYGIEETPGTWGIVTRTTSPGQELTITNQTSTTLTVAGDKSATTVYIGRLYTRTYTFNKFYMREENRNGGSTIITAGRLQIRTCTITFADTGTFTVTVTQDHRDPSSYVAYRDPFDSVFTGRVLGAGSNLLGAVALADGEFRFPVMSENTKVTITVSTNSFLPMRLLSAEWEGTYHARSRRG